jgi:hypothetical protein
MTAMDLEDEVSTTALITLKALPTLLVQSCSSL